MPELLPIFSHSLMITIFVFTMMLIVDYVNVLTKEKMEKIAKGGKLWQYTVASFLGATPGCLGAFLNVSLYIHGLLSLGAIAGGMIATSGDEAFVMLTLFPKKAILLFALLFILGIGGSWIADRVGLYLKITPCQECNLLKVHHQKECRCFEPAVMRNIHRSPWQRYVVFLFFLGLLLMTGLGILGAKTWTWQRITLFSLLIITTFIVITVPDHYLKVHIWSHIVKKHLWQVFLWIFFALFFIALATRYLDLEGFIKGNMGVVLLISALVGIIPESGPHMVFVMMFAHGLIPFSVLLTGSIVQDGHGMLPLLSYTVRDSVLIKVFNLIFGLIIGLCLLFLGL